jgi:hypothetical protein
MGLAVKARQGFVSYFGWFCMFKFCVVLPVAGVPVSAL